MNYRNRRIYSSKNPTSPTMTWWSPAHVFPSSEDYYKQQYYQLIDTALCAIQVRFESDTWRFLSTVEVALTPGYSATLTRRHQRRAATQHTAMLHDFVKQKQQTINNFGDIVDLLRTDAAIRSLLPEQTKCIRILLTIPLSSCTAERSFSALRFLKTFMLPWHRHA